MNHPIRDERERQGLTLDALADKAAVSVRSLRRAESVQHISEETKTKIADALGVTVTDLWGEVRIGSMIAAPEGAYRIQAVASDGSYIIAPAAFGPNEVVTAAEVKQRFGVTVRTATQSERHGYAALAEASRLNANRIERAHAQRATEQEKVNASESGGWARMAEAMYKTR